MSPYLDDTDFFSCSLSCFKIHKDQCTPKPTKQTPETPIVALPTTTEPSSTASPIKVEKEYALLLPSQLSLLRTSHPLDSSSPPGKDPDIVKNITSPALKTLFRNILANIPTATDLTEINTDTAGPLESALSLIQ